MMERIVMEENLERLEELKNSLEERYGVFIDEFGCMVVERKNSLEEEKEILMARELKKTYEEIEEKEILKVLKETKRQGWSLEEILSWLKKDKKNFFKLKEALSALENLKEKEEKEMILVDPGKLSGFPYVLAKALESISSEGDEKKDGENEDKENSFNNLKLVSRIPVKTIVKEEIETILRCVVQDMIFNSGSVKEYVRDLSLLTMEDEEKICSFVEKLENLLKNRLRGLFKRIEKLEKFSQELKKKKISFKEIKKIEKELVVLGKKVYLLGIILRNKLKKLGIQSKGIYKEIFFLIRRIVDEYFERFWIQFTKTKKNLRKRKNSFKRQNKKKLNK